MLGVDLARQHIRVAKTLLAVGHQFVVAEPLDGSPLVMHRLDITDIAGQRLLRWHTFPSVLLIEAGPRVLPGYPVSTARRIVDNARARGIEIRCGAGVAAAHHDGLTLEEGT